MSSKRRRDRGESSKNRIANTIALYRDLPREQCKRWVLSDSPTVLGDYLHLLDWISYWGTLDGLPMEGIRSLSFKKGYPLIEVQIGFEMYSIKLLISRASLYVLAFHSGEVGWKKFSDSEIDIVFDDEEVVQQMDRQAKYEGTPWKILGPSALIKAFNDIHLDDETACLACEVFAVHVSEACRLRLVKSVICESLIPCVADWGVMSENSENVLVCRQNCIDILDSMKPLRVDLSKSIDGGIQVSFFMKWFKQLSVAWMVFALTRKNICHLDKKISQKCGIKFRKSLRHSLLLLSNTNVEKVICTLEGQLDKGTAPPHFTSEDLDIMKFELRKLRKIGD